MSNKNVNLMSDKKFKLLMLFFIVLFSLFSIKAIIDDRLVYQLKDEIVLEVDSSFDHKKFNGKNLSGKVITSTERDSFESIKRSVFKESGLDLNKIEFYKIDIDVSKINSDLSKGSIRFKYNDIDKVHKAKFKYYVKDTTPPVIRQIQFTIERGESYSLSDYVDVSDNSGGIVDLKFSEINSSILGDHEVSVTGTDMSGNVSKLNFTVTILGFDEEEETIDNEVDNPNDNMEEDVKDDSSEIADHEDKEKPKEDIVTKKIKYSDKKHEPYSTTIKEDKNKFWYNVGSKDSGYKEKLVSGKEYIYRYKYEDTYVNGKYKGTKDLGIEVIQDREDEVFSIGIREGEDIENSVKMFDLINEKRSSEELLEAKWSDELHQEAKVIASNFANDSQPPINLDLGDYKYIKKRIVDKPNFPELALESWLLNEGDRNVIMKDSDYEGNVSYEAAATILVEDKKSYGVYIIKSSVEKDSTTDHSE